MLRRIVSLLLLVFSPAVFAATEQWGVFEAVFEGPSGGNPFTDVTLTAEFRQGDAVFTPEGFYDGEGVYRVRFMPNATGTWMYTTQSNVPQLDGKTGSFECVPPGPDNHGPVHVADGLRFAYADGTPHFSVGTTCYAWTHQGDELEEQTLATLAASPFNKLRMCVFPKDYSYNKNEPIYYPFPRDADGTNDFSRFNPDHFRHFEERVKQVQELGIETDIILFHPYDRWGYQSLDRETADRYLRYVIARLAAYRGIWWSLANEYDFMDDFDMDDWDHYFQTVQNADPYDHLRSIHNAGTWYDHNKPWVTHLSIQTSNFADAREFREKYGKPVVYDECRYEGNVRQGWGNISGQRMVYNFWAGVAAGCYVGHGETYQHPDDILWWAKGGVLHGESPERIAFMKAFIEDLPWWEMEPDFDIAPGNPVLAKPGERYLLFFADNDDTTIDLPGDRPYKVDGIDTWNMTVEPIGTAMPGGYTLAPPGPYYALYITPYGEGEALRPVAQATASVSIGEAPLEVTFSAPNGLACAWDFGDGATSIESEPTHTYSAHGQYPVRLRVTNAEGQTAVTATKVTVLPGTPRLDEAQAWPGLAEGLAFQWDGGNAGLDAEDGATLPGDGPMNLGKGAIVVPAAGAALRHAVHAANQFALTARITPANLDQRGPARIVTYSLDHNSRNFTLGQDRDKLVLRLRTTENSGNATDPTITLCTLEAGEPVHITVSYFPGYLACYVDGELAMTTTDLQGDLSNWDDEHTLAFGDERVGGRAWAGKVEHIALYGRFIGEAEAHKLYALAD